MLLKLNSVAVERYLEQYKGKKDGKILIKLVGKIFSSMLVVQNPDKSFLINTLLGSFYSLIWQLPKKSIPLGPMEAFKKAVTTH